MNKLFHLLKSRCSKEVLTITNKKSLSFQQKLEQDILRKVSLISFLGLILIFVCVIIFYLVNIYATIQTEKKQLETTYYDLKQTYTTRLTDLSTALVRGGLIDSSKSRQLYTMYYDLMKYDERNMLGRLLILDRDFQQVFDSSPENNSSNKLISYIKTVHGHENRQNKTLERVYLSQEKIHYLVLTQPIVAANQIQGYASILIESSSFRPDNNLSRLNYYFYDKYDNVFAMSSPYFLVGTLEKLAPNFERPFQIENKKMLLSNQTKLSEDMTLLVLMQETSLQIVLVLLFVSISLLFLSLMAPIRLLARRFAENNSENVAFISSEMAKVGKNNNYRFKIESGDEFEDLAVNINAMLDRIDSLHKNNLALTKENALSERKKLEAQFDPHFLYNTLETIRIASQYDPKLANEMILSLNAVLRYSISETVDYSAVKDDIDYIKHYLKIYEIRFDGLTYDIQIEANLENLIIPKLLLLPVIENSLKYGLLRSNKLQLLIEIKSLPNGDVILSVVDNGGGIAPEIVDHVNSISHDNTGNHHGLYNSKRRFLLAYPHSSFYLFSQNNEAAVIMLIKKEDVHNVYVSSHWRWKNYS